MLLTEILDEVPDPRGYNAVHDLTDVLFVALAAVLCGAVHCTALHADGVLREDAAGAVAPVRPA